MAASFRFLLDGQCERVSKVYRNVAAVSGLYTDAKACNTAYAPEGWKRGDRDDLRRYCGAAPISGLVVGGESPYQGCSDP